MFMSLYVDQLGRTIELHAPPKRIISLVPSQTELLYDLGLNEEVVGITRFCIHPNDWLRSKTRIGGTKQLDLKKIKELQPDLIIANKEENLREQIEELAIDFPVWISDVDNLNNALEMIVSIGIITNKAPKAKEICMRIHDSFSLLKTLQAKLSTCYLIWREPYMTVGGDTFISNMMQHAGFQNMFVDRKRYPEITVEQLQAAGCQLLLLSSEPFPFKQKHVQELQNLLPDTKIVLVDGEMFSWYGSRLLKAPGYFQQLKNQVLSLGHVAGTE
jgi:ABC-type Fe3+-hydroxamate transport system substrate-binding protein